jgi:hypothetical protein
MFLYARKVQEQSYRLLNREEYYIYKKNGLNASVERAMWCQFRPHGGAKLLHKYSYEVMVYCVLHVSTEVMYGWKEFYYFMHFGYLCTVIDVCKHWCIFMYP